MVACIIPSDHPEKESRVGEREKETERTREIQFDLHCSNKPHLCVIC